MRHTNPAHNTIRVYRVVLCATVVRVLFGITTLMLVVAFFQRHALACEFLPAMDYQRVTGDVFVETDLSVVEVDALLMLINSASERMSQVYGTPTSKPRLLITTDPGTAANWGANRTGTMHRIPWRSCIIIGPNGQNVDVIAHEWLHAEVQHRVGFLRVLTEIPTWFDEGAALTLDYREPFLTENIDLAAADLLAVKNLRSGSDFFSGNIQKNYQSARLAVEPLIRNEQFFEDLERISLGESFEAVFLHANESLQQKALIAPIL